MIDGVIVVDHGQHRHFDVAAELTSAIDEIIREADA
jgi:hypothetical protein